MAGVGHTHRIVVIEHHHDFRAAMMKVLAAQQWDVTGAADGGEASAALQTAPRPCVILLDLMMPAMDGRQFMSELRVHPVFARVPVIATTAYGTPEGTRALGATACLMKPFALSRLVEMVRHLCPFADTA